MDATAFLKRVEQFRQDGCRLVLINACSLVPKTAEEEGAVDLAWTFERAGALEHLREQVVPGRDEVPSVSASFPFAFLYENEIAELFGVKITGCNVDFKGQLYQTTSKVPMSPKAIRARLQAAKEKKP